MFDSSVIRFKLTAPVEPTKGAAASHTTRQPAAMFFSIPATGKARDKKPKELPKEEPKEKAPGTHDSAAAARPAAAAAAASTLTRTRLEDVHAAAAALYPSMRPDYDPEARAADEAPRKRTVVVEDAARPTSSFCLACP